jgi:hypothetical protein
MNDGCENNRRVLPRAKNDEYAATNDEAPDGGAPAMEGTGQQACFGYQEEWCQQEGLRRPVLLPLLRR